MSSSGKVEHTKGPWRVNLRRGTINGAQIVNDRAELVVNMPAKADRPIYQKRADADLIAAAPDMLHALKVTVAIVEDFLSDPAQDQDHVLATLDSCRAALAKAESRTSKGTPE